MSARPGDHASLSQDKKIVFSDRSENFRALIPPRELSKTDEKVGGAARDHGELDATSWCNFGFSLQYNIKATCILHTFRCQSPPQHPETPETF